MILAEYAFHLMKSGVCFGEQTLARIDTSPQFDHEMTSC